MKYDIKINEENKENIQVNSIDFREQMKKNNE